MTAGAVAIAIAIAAELLMGGAVVCAEARGQHPFEQVAVGRVISNRARRAARPAIAIMSAPGQFARPCPAGLLRLEHVAAYAQGRWGDAPEWAMDATHFVARRIESKVAARWTRRGLERVESGATAHSFWEPKEHDG